MGDEILVTEPVEVTVQGMLKVRNFQFPGKRDEE